MRCSSLGMTHTFDAVPTAKSHGDSATTFFWVLWVAVPVVVSVTVGCGPGRIELTEVLVEAVLVVVVGAVVVSVTVGCEPGSIELTESSVVVATVSW